MTIEKISDTPIELIVKIREASEQWGPLFVQYCIENYYDDLAGKQIWRKDGFRRLGLFNKVLT